MSTEKHVLDIEVPVAETFDISSMGEGYRLIDRKTFELNIGHAAEFLEYPEFIINDEKIDRDRSASHVIYLARAMLGGTFLWEQVNLVICSLDGNSQPIRLNGNHTCWARLVADDEGLDKKTRCPVQLMRYKAKTEQDMRQLYSTLDRGRPRGAGVVINSYLLGTEDFPGYPKVVLRLLAQGLGVWLWETGTERNLHGSDDRAFLLLKDHHKTALAVGTILNEETLTKHIRRAPVVAAMLATCAKAPVIAHEFWKDIRDGLGLTDKQDPRRVLRDWLMQASLAKSAFSGDMKTVTQEAMYRACVYRWNDFRSGRKSKATRIDQQLKRPEAQ